MDPSYRLLPRLYLGWAFSSLITAGVVLAWDPASLAGFFYHPRLLAVVHLITLGWLTGSLLGLLYLAAPRLLGKALPASRTDTLVFGLFSLSSSGVIFHFWIREMSGVGWSGLLVALVVLQVGVRFLVESADAPVPKGFQLCCLLALLNLVGAAILGIAIALDRYVDVLPGFVLHHVFAHAHLAALGWAALLLLGLAGALQAGSTPPKLVTGVIVFELATLALVVAFLGDAGHRPAALVLTVAVCCMAAMCWKAVPLASFELRQALFYLGLTCALGIALAFLPEGQIKLRAIFVYGIFGLLGFLATLPLALLRPFEGAEDSRWRILGRWSWSVSTPLLAIGFAWEALPILRAGGVALMAAAVVAWLRPWPGFTGAQKLKSSP